MAFVATESKPTSREVTLLVEKRILWATALILIALSAFAIVAYADTLRLTPRGRIRVSLEDNSAATSGGGRATWNPFIQVFDGSFSAELNTGTVAGTAFAAVVISPFNIALTTLKTVGAGGIRFWVYFYDTPSSNQQLVVDLVLDNGRVMEGYGSEPVVAGPILSESDLGYPTSEIWRLMKPVDKFYSSFATSDPLIDDSWTIGNPQTIATWQADPDFATAKVIQLRIAFFSDGTNKQAFIDNVTFIGITVLIEPESIGLPPHAVP